MAQVWEIQLQHNEAFVLLALADHANDAGGQIFPSLRRIAWKTGYSKRAIQKIMEQLKARGILIQVRGPRRHHAPEYQIDFSVANWKAPFRGEDSAPLEPSRVEESASLEASASRLEWNSATSRVEQSDTRVELLTSRVELASATYPSSEPSEKPSREPSLSALRAVTTDSFSKVKKSDPEEARKQKELSDYRNKMFKSGLYSDDEMISFKGKSFEELRDIDAARFLEKNPHLVGPNGSDNSSAERENL
jgi:hypothetical protein